MAREVARYNAMQQNAQTLNINMNNTILHRAKTEILRCVELLIEKMQIEMSDLLVEVSMIVVNGSEVPEKKSESMYFPIFNNTCGFDNAVYN